MNFPSHFGIKLVVPANPEFMVESARKQFRHPKNKKHRINKKWRKNPSNYKTVVTGYKTYSDVKNNVIYVHPVVLEAIKNQQKMDVSIGFNNIPTNPIGSIISVN